jgi:aminoglycoside 2'-N-acetyltransferase I
VRLAIVHTVVIRTLTSSELSEREHIVLRELFEDAYEHDPGTTTDEDWAQGFGGMHFILDHWSGILAHAAVVRRELRTAEHRLDTGYVENVAVWSAHQRKGHGRAVMEAVNRYIDESFQLGGLATGSRGFYVPLGWTLWRGPTYVRTDQGLERTAEEDGHVLVRLTPTSPDLDTFAPISCEWRPSEIW